MSDVHTPETRSYNMSRIRGKDTKPEETVRKYLFSQGFRYRKNDKKLPGKPDIVLPKYRTVIFVNGCFWHRHDGCRYAYTPKTRVDFWKKKFADNTKRDQKVQKALLKDNIKCIIIWECTVKKMMKDKVFHDEMLEKIEGALNSEKQFNEF